MIKKDKKFYFVKSNLLEFLHGAIFPVFMLCAILYLGEFTELVLIWSSVFLVFSLYILSVFTLNFYIFYDEYVERFYPTRFFFRSRKIKYSDIEFVKYYGDIWGALIRIYIKGGRKGIYHWGNSFLSGSFKSSQKALLFLKSKGIPIVIKSKDEKKQKILGIDNSDVPK